MTEIDIFLEKSRFPAKKRSERFFGAKTLVIHHNMSKKSLKAKASASPKVDTVNKPKSTIKWSENVCSMRFRERALTNTRF